MTFGRKRCSIRSVDSAVIALLLAGCCGRLMA